jgi:signal transduction histidine kinase
VLGGHPQQDNLDGERWAILSVRDHGIGIPAADMPYVFDLYHRAGNSA